ncbi:MAG: chitobiase/beta-hexosaminidase C-terminal domain-containing protein [Candidatus Bipolaricaulota bacterium]|nr:chitobiase/beta-hexosaminidase C-terminal domain-containing protein [Candidatus Bipolaricaulota bacterium]
MEQLLAFASPNCATQGFAVQTSMLAPPDVILVVAEETLNQLGAEIDQYMSNVQGANPLLHLWLLGSPPAETAESLRAKLVEEWTYWGGDLSGVILIGDLPTAEWKFSSGEVCPLPLYYEDLDGEFSDTDQDGYLDTHQWGANEGPEIWVAYIRGMPLWGSDPQEAKYWSLKWFFTKSHWYYAGSDPYEGILPDALLYVATDWAGSSAAKSQYFSLPDAAGGNCLSSLYDELMKRFNTSRQCGGTSVDDYIAKLTSEPRAFVDVWTHTSPWQHYFDDGSMLDSSLLASIGTAGLLTMIWGCHAGDFIEGEDLTLAQAYVFAEPLGLASVAAVRSIGTEYQEVFVQGLDGTAGEAFKGWLDYVYDKNRIQARFPQDDIDRFVWDFILFGDPFLRLPLKSCRCLVSPTGATASVGGGSGTIAVTIGTGCTWSAGESCSWVTISPTSGTGSGTITWNAVANAGCSSRSCTITICNKPFTLSQAGGGGTCTISPTSATVPAGSGSGTIAVTIGAGCTWTASESCDWVTISPTSGTGSGTVTWNASANPGCSSRSCTITICDKSFALSQAAGAGTCTISPTSASAPVGGGSGTITVTTGCAWTASESCDWVTISPTSGAGSGTVTWNATANPTCSSRSCTITICGNSFVLSQAGTCCSWEDDMESGQTWTATGLWHLATKKSHSPTHSQWFGDESTGTYGPGSAPKLAMSAAERAASASKATGRAVGELTSPVIAVAGGTTATLSFWHWREVEYYAGSYDKTYVQVSYGGGAWQTVWSLDSSTSSSKTWGQVNQDLSVPSGVSSLQVRFVFDSMDSYNNSYGGWFIDDVCVTAAGSGKVSAVSFSPVPGTYGAPVSVALACATAGATICYTTDGAEPIMSSSSYSSAIPVAVTTTIKARAFKAGLADSDVSSGTYVIESSCSWEDDMESGQTWTATGLWHLATKKSHSPTHSQWFGDEGTGTYGQGSAPKLVTSAAERAANASKATGRAVGELTSPVIAVAGGTTATLSFWHWREVEHYAGSYDKTYVQVSYGGGAWQTVWALDSATASSKAWGQVSQELSVPSGASSLQVRFVFDSVDSYNNNYAGWFIDDVCVSAAGSGKVSAVSFSPVPGTYGAPVSVALTCATAGATIRYTVDGAEPTASSSAYSTTISVAASTTIKARAFKAGLADSDVSSGTYVIESSCSWEDDMESGQTWTATGLWHLATKKSHSATHSQWFGDEVTGTYGPGSAPKLAMSAAERAASAPKATGRAVGELTSPVIAVTGGTTATLSFWQWREVEHYAGSYDKTYVQVSYGAGAWQTVWGLDSSTPSSKTWGHVNQELSVPSGVSALQVRFVFDSVDSYNNNYTGWFVDDVGVSCDGDVVDLSSATNRAEELRAICLPNPVRDVHTCSFYVQGGEVEATRVCVYDLAGSLVFEGEEPGDEIEWHTDNYLGEYLANGVYLYRVWALIESEWILVEKAGRVVILR